MATRAEIQALISETQAKLQSLGAASLETADGLAAANQAVADRDATIAAHLARIGELEAALADCQDVEPDPEPDPTPWPSGEFWWGDDMTLLSADAIRRTTEFGNPDKVGWGQYSGPGSVSSKVVFHPATDGPLVNGVRRPYRRITCNNGDSTGDSGDSDSERVEIGQVNNPYGCVYPVGSEMVTYQRIRVPTNLPWTSGGRGGGGSGSLMQMKHAADSDGNSNSIWEPPYGGFGGNPISPASPIGMGQDKDGIYVQERGGDYTAREVWQQAVPHMQWWDLVLHIKYAFNGFIKIYWGLNGQTPTLRHSSNRSTVKPNRDGDPMYSTFRNGIYQANEAPARTMDIGPVTVERIV